METLPSPVPVPLPSPIAPASIEDLQRYQEQLAQLGAFITRYKPLIDKYGATLRQDLEAISHSPRWGLWLGCQIGWFFVILATKHSSLAKTEALLMRGAIRVFFTLVFWTGASVVIPTLVFGDPYVRLIHLLWDIGNQLISQKL